MIRLSAALVWLLPAILAACSPELDADLLEVESVSPSRVELGTRLRLRGAGFSAGRDATVVLDGEVRRPGEHPRRLRVELPARARSPEEVEFLANARFFDEVGGRGSFRGEMQVRFARAEGSGTVSGRLRTVELEFAPSTAMRLEQGRAQAERAAALVERLGLVLGTEEEAPPGGAGLTVLGVTAGGAAARAGLLEGDRILTLDGLALDGPSDFLPAAHAEVARLEVRRASSGRLEIALPLSELDPTEAPSRRAYLWGTILLVLALALSPTARLATRLAGRLTRIGEGSPAVRIALPLEGIALTIGGGSPLLVLLLGRSVDLLALLCFFALPFFLAGRWRSRRAVGFLVGLASVGGLLLLVGTTDLAKLSSLQGVLPWGWLLVRHPGALVFALSYGLGMAAAMPTPEERLSPLSATVLRFGASGVFAAAFLGPVLEGSGLVATFVFLAKVVAVSLLLERSSSTRVSALAGSLTLVLGGALAFAWALGWLPSALDRVSPPLLSLLLFGIAARTIYALRLAGRRSSAPVLHPFL